LYQAAVDVEPVGDESEPRGRDLSAAEPWGLLKACVPAPRVVGHRPDSAARHCRDAAFLSLLYAAGPRRAEAVALDLADPRSQQRVLLRDLDLRVSEPGVSEELPVRARSSRSTGVIDPNAEPDRR
jgi:integrase